MTKWWAGFTKSISKTTECPLNDCACCSPGPKVTRLHIPVRPNRAPNITKTFSMDEKKKEKTNLSLQVGTKQKKIKKNQEELLVKEWSHAHFRLLLQVKLWFRARTFNNTTNKRSENSDGEKYRKESAGQRHDIISSIFIRRKLIIFSTPSSRNAKWPRSVLLLDLELAKKSCACCFYGFFYYSCMNYCSCFLFLFSTTTKSRIVWFLPVMCNRRMNELSNELHRIICICQLTFSLFFSLLWFNGNRKYCLSEFE